MEFRSTTITAIFVLLLLLFTGKARLLKGVRSNEMDSGVYEIDYKGPETHTSIPPPNHSHRNPSHYDREGSLTAPRSKSSKATEKKRNGNKVHG